MEWKFIKKAEVHTIDGMIETLEKMCGGEWQ